MRDDVSPPAPGRRPRQGTTTPTPPERHLRKWVRLAPLGLGAVGLGVSLAGEATLRKSRGTPWVLYGTAALGVLNAGLCLFGEAVKHRALADMLSQYQDRTFS